MATPPDQTPGGVITRRAAATPFEVHLDVFSGPFDLLLGLISKHKLDITEIALAAVTDEFVAHIRAAQAEGDDWDLGQASEFLVVAATLLDIKAARLLPTLTETDDEDLALIEARDLLFARLLQYRAYKEIAATFAASMQDADRFHPRSVPMEPRFAALLPELVLSVTPEQLAMIAAGAMVPRVPPSVGLAHLHLARVSVVEQVAVIVDRLRRERTMSFRALVADAESTLVIVARFLAILELFKESAVAFEQAEPLGELDVRWTGSDDGEIAVTADYDGPVERPEPPLEVVASVTEDDAGDDDQSDDAGHEWGGSPDGT